MKQRMKRKTSNIRKETLYTFCHGGNHMKWCRFTLFFFQPFLELAWQQTQRNIALYVKQHRAQAFTVKEHRRKKVQYNEETQQKSAIEWIGFEKQLQNTGKKPHTLKKKDYMMNSQALRKAEVEEGNCWQKVAGRSLRIQKKGCPQTHRWEYDHRQKRIMCLQQLHCTPKLESENQRRPSGAFGRGGQSPNSTPPIYPQWEQAAAHWGLLTYVRRPAWERSRSSGPRSGRSGKERPGRWPPLLLPLRRHTTTSIRGCTATTQDQIPPSGLCGCGGQAERLRGKGGNEKNTQKSFFLRSFSKKKFPLAKWNGSLGFCSLGLWCMPHLK